MASPPTTHELRWFTSAAPDSSLDVAFDALGVTPLGDESDVHVYLRDAEPGLGVKWRDDALEVKQRLGVAGRIVSIGALEAAPERWVKWRLEVPTVSAPRADAWIQVTKRRRLAFVDGCQVELTSFDADERIAYTLGLESFDPQAVEAVAKRLDRMLPALAAGAWRASGWPAWLAGGAPVPERRHPGDAPSGRPPGAGR